MKPVIHQNVCEVIVPAEMCAGCGICAAICPVNVLEMRFNEYSELVPVEVQPGCLSCPLCLQTCPFWNQDDNEDSLAESAFGHEPGISHRSETGYYLKSFVGHVSDSTYRVTRSSGAVATWLQQTYLREGLADHVINVVPNNDPNQLFRFAVLNTLDDIRHSARSAYYPVEMSGVVAEVLKTPGRYVVTGLPCFLKGLRLAMCHSSKLRKRIVCTVGLVCGQSKSKFFAEYLCAVIGGDPAHLVKVDFRCKSPGRASSEFAAAFELKESQGSRSLTSLWTDEYGKAWRRGYFTLNACNYCDDVFAETADIAVMDAWLPEITHDWRGANLAILRSPQVLALIESGIEEHVLAMEEIEIDQVIISQTGVLMEKRENLAHRLHLSTKQGQSYVPNKRVKPKKLSSPIDRWLFSCKERMRVLSRQKLADLDHHRDAEQINLFQSEMAGAVLLYRGVRSIERLVRGLPRRFIRKMRRLNKFVR